MSEPRQAWAVPSRPRPIIIIGAGGIVRTAHLPAYRRLKFPIAGLFDINSEAASSTAKLFDVDRVFASIDEASATQDGIFDIAVPGDQIAGVLRQLPRGAPVLIQKPMGDTLESAREILAICRERGLVAALNFQLRFSPNVLVLRDLLAQG
jgi:predicted dehydrogenase